MNMDLDEIKKEIRTFLARYIRDPHVKDEDDLFASGFINSLFAMQMVLFVEKKFAVKVENDDLDRKNFATINALARFVSHKTSSERTGDS
jgi:methoxymalonate biosynthesis acyl carrier protein